VTKEHENGRSALDQVPRPDDAPLDVNQLERRNGLINLRRAYGVELFDVDPPLVDIVPQLRRLPGLEPFGVQRIQQIDEALGHDVFPLSFRGLVTPFPTARIMPFPARSVSGG
jgi:hypothetical protein